MSTVKYRQCNRNSCTLQARIIRLARSDTCDADCERLPLSGILVRKIVTDHDATTLVTVLVIP